MPSESEKEKLEAALKQQRRSFYLTAQQILGPGYVPDYYDQTICCELRAAFVAGWNARKAEPKEASCQAK